MQRLVLLILVSMVLWAQVSPQSSENQIRSRITVMETDALREATGPVEQWLGRKLIVYEPADALTLLPGTLVFPSQPEATEALITPTAVFVAKGTFKQFRSSFELAEFLTHAAAHVRLDHAQKWAEKLEMARVRAGSVDLAKTRKEFEDDANHLADDLLPSTDCGPGPCSRFGRLLAAARK